MTTTARLWKRESARLWRESAQLWRRESAQESAQETAQLHGISTGDPLRSAPRPHNRPARSLGRPERPLQAPSKSGNQKKIGFPHLTSHMVHVRAEGVLGRGRNFRPL